MARILEGQNSAKPEEIASYVDEIERLTREHLEFKMQKMAEISASASRLTTAIKEQLDDAKSKGAQKSTIKTAVALRIEKAAYEKKIRGKIDDTEADQKPILIGIFKALGDDFASFGLGAAAVNASGEKKPSSGKDPIADAA